MFTVENNQMYWRGCGAQQQFISMTTFLLAKGGEGGGVGGDPMISFCVYSMLSGKHGLNYHFVILVKYRTSP